jgi:outer membrane immunogenic protein
LKKSLLASASLGAIALATGAHAADMGRPVYEAPAPAPIPFTWSGFYIGANVGAVWGRSSATDDPTKSSELWIGSGTVGSVDANSTGIIGGLQLGYNWQFASLVVGLEGDISFSSLDHTSPVTTSPGGGVDSYRSRLSALGTIRGRVGWAFDRLLVYGTGGVAFASLKDEYFDPPSVIGFTTSPSSGVTGWTAGGGIEYAFTDHWTVRGEYLHVEFPDRSAGVLPFIRTAYTFTFKDSLDIARVGINYKF